MQCDCEVLLPMMSTKSAVLFLLQAKYNHKEWNMPEKKNNIMQRLSLLQSTQELSPYYLQEGYLSP
jgi:hypothetical protein